MLRLIANRFFGVAISVSIFRETDQFRVTYFGSSIKVRFLKPVLRDHRNDWIEGILVRKTELEQLICAEVTTIRLRNLASRAWPAVSGSQKLPPNGRN